MDEDGGNAMQQPGATTKPSTSICLRSEKKKTTGTAGLTTRKENVLISVTDEGEGGDQVQHSSVASGNTRTT